MPATNLVEFAAATAAILATPGPANTLLATAGATSGLRRSLRLIPVEWLGYAIAITLWIALGRSLLAAHPAAGWLFRAGVVVYLFYKAYHLWQASGRAHADGLRRDVVTVRFCFTTAVSNPKGLIFATFVFPPYQSVTQMRPFAGVFTVLAMTFALCWTALGAGLGRSFLHGDGGAVVTRIAAITLAAFAAILSVSLVL